MQSAQPSPGTTHQPEPHPGAARALRWALWSLLCWFGSPVALYMGLRAKREIEATPGRYANAGSATLAVVLGAVGTALLGISMVVGLVTEQPAPTNKPASVSTVPQASTPRAESEPAPSAPAVTDTPEALDEAAYLAEVRSLIADVTKLRQQAVPMERLRRDSDTTALVKCGEMMRELQPQAEALRERAMKLPLRHRVHVGTAAGNMILCASCKRDAKDFCKMVERDVKAATDSLK